MTCAPTGVKHLHHAAAERYDIGVYFEANGHGTVLFSSSAQRKIASHKPSTTAQATALGRLKDVIDVINQTVGDALSDMLLVEVALYHMSYSVETWDKLYSDLPNRLVKVKVGDRNAFVTEDAERRLVRPLGLQARIDQLVQRTGGRSFVRPSGTEDVVRVYAEAQETDDAIGKRPVLDTRSTTNFVVQILPSVSPDLYTMRRVETLRRGRRTLGDNDVEGQNVVNLSMCTWVTTRRLVSCSRESNDVLGQACPRRNLAQYLCDSRSARPEMFLPAFVPPILHLSYPCVDL